MEAEPLSKEGTSDSSNVSHGIEPRPVSTSLDFPQAGGHDGVACRATGPVSAPHAFLGWGEFVSCNPPGRDLTRRIGLVGGCSATHARRGVSMKQAGAVA